MKKHHRKWPSVPGDPAIPGYGSGRGNGGVEGANSLRVTGGCQLTKLTLATYNGRTIRLDSHLTELEVELSRINWHILGLSEVRREGEDTITLESGHLLYFREGDRASQGGVGFLVNKTLVNNVVEVNSVSNRVAYLVLKLTNSGSTKMRRTDNRTLWIGAPKSQGANAGQLPRNAGALLDEFLLQEEAPEEMDLAEPRHCDEERDRFHNGG
ncbi:hypothetical protein K1T71_012745 [Dendrolimus kikuchii]|uniref:Uncharacterized protein n=1 Tax=Dendrolimus kikuchii TaxID=765133 RepID=A0ACC1CKI4_9NEOP|nr:hypothetical protein K1T71_012745 [Dendrolimus kikuchii]